MGDHFPRSFCFFHFFFAQPRSFWRSFWWSTFFVNKKWVFGYSVFSIFIESHWVGTRWWPRKFTGPGGTFTLNWCIASECYERDSVSNECFENSSTPSVNDHSQYSFYGSIWVVAEYYYSLNYLSRPVFRTYYTVFALSKHLCTVQYTYHGLDRWTSEINLALTKWTPCHVIFTFWKKRVSRSYCDHFSFRLFRRKPRSFVCDHFGRSFCFFHLFVSFDKRDHFSGRSF